MVTRTYQERFKTYKGVFDEFTERNLFELQSKGHFDGLLIPFRIGKESNVFIADKAGKKIIIKIYRVQNCDFKRMFHYIRQDPRYQYLKSQRREIIFSWTQREYKNLIKAEKGKVRSPKPISWKNNIILEELIGKDEPAPPLKDQPPKNPKKFFAEVVEQMRLLYQAGLIHGDLSAFNILNYNEKPYLIDFSQSTIITTPNWKELLHRDIKNVLQFFSGFGISANPEDIFKKVTEK
jgi:RIO kinase 1